MVSKKFAVLFFLLFASIFMVGTAQAGWHEWSQNARNETILNTAYKDLNQKVNVSCKVWVQNVVSSASNGAVAVPRTVDPPGWYWYPSRYVLGRCGRIEDAQPGEIVQMRVNLTNYKGPHTAIVVTITRSGITFIESNWCDNNCEIVRTRYMSFATFYSQVVNFTINYIL